MKRRCDLPLFCRSSRTRCHQYNPYGQRDRGTFYAGNCSQAFRKNPISAHISGKWQTPL